MKIAIIGLGYVGLPLALALSKSNEVIGFDINVRRIDELKRKSDRTGEVSSKELSTTELDEISKDLSKSMGSTIKFDYKVDKELIGGLKLQLGSFMIDTSIKNKLKKYKLAMLEN